MKQKRSFENIRSHSKHRSNLSLDKTKAYNIKPQRTQFFTIINLDSYSATFAEPTKKILTNNEQAMIF